MISIRPRLLIPVLACSLFLGACSTVRVQTDYDPEFDFSGLRSFAWASPVQEKMGDARLDNPLMDARIRKAIDATLVEQGFEPAEREAADFVVAYHLSLDQRLDVYTMNSRYSRRGYGGTTTTVSQYEQGTLIIDFAVENGEQLVWRGVGTRRLSRNASPEKSTENVNRAVAEILARFPPDA
jgi:hypothetical protein